MQVSVEKTSELSREMTVSIPDEVVQEKMESKYKSLANTAKVDGFRPGKVPLRVVKKMFGSKVQEEVFGDLIKETYSEALQEQKMNPIGYPHIKSVNEENGLEYVAEFEEYPVISLDDLSSLEVKRPVATIEQADQDEMVAKLREQKKEWKDAERAAENDDRVTIHFSGVCDGENFTEGKVENYPLQIGANTMIPGFEDEIVGLEAGATKTFDITFPEEYHSDQLAGKKAEFDIEVVKIEASSLPEVDEEFIKSYGIEDGTVDSFNADIKENMARGLVVALKGKLKGKVLDEMYEKIQFEVPTVLIDQEIQGMINAQIENAKRQGVKADDLNLPRDAFEEQAKRRVSVGLLFSEIIQKNEIKVDDAIVRTTIEEMSNSYENPAEVVEWYYSDAEKSRLEEVKQMVLEDQTVDWIVNQAKVTEEPISFTDVMKK
ncbi:MAG: trigger factor [Methylococcales bacterium]|nr:trigger factor [Methylococcales bacterium]